MKRKILVAVSGLIVIVGVLAGAKALQIKALIDQGKTFSVPPEVISATEVKQESIDPAEARSITLQGLDATVRIGRFGPYIERQDNGNALRVSVPESVAPADLNGEIIETLLREKKEGPTSLGVDPETGLPIYIRTGQYGPYVQLGDATDEQPKPKRMSLPRGVKPEDVTLELARGLLALPRVLGIHPETGAKVLGGLGRFGPYVVHDQGKVGKDYRSIKGEDIPCVRTDHGAGSSLAVDHLVSITPAGFPSLTTYLNMLGAGMAWQDAFRTAFGMSVEAYYANFASYRAGL